MKRIIEPTEGNIFISRIHAELEHDGSDEYVVCSNEDTPEWKLYIEPDQWPELRKLLNKMIKECRK